MAEGGDPLVGKTLGGYRVELLLNHGPRYSVYRAVQLSVSRRVAIKVARSSSNPERKDLFQFVEKARFAACRTHPCIVQLHDVCRETDSLFYSMEFLPGGTLADLVSRKGALAWQTAIQLLHDGASALLFAEEEGIVHGDLNPTHLLFTEEGRLKLLNLGLTRDPWCDGEKPEQPGPLFLNFASPEQLRSERPSPRSDLYGLGYSFYYAISGRLPFEGKSLGEVSEAKATARPPRLRAPSDKVPGWLCDLIGSMLHPDPAQRPGSAADVTEAIDRHSGDLRFRGDRQPTRFARRSPAPKAPRVLVMPCAVLVALIAILACFYGPPPDLAPRAQSPPPETALPPAEPSAPPEAPVQPLTVPPAPPAAELVSALEAIKAAIKEAQLARDLAPALNTADQLASEENYRAALQHLRDLHDKLPEAPEIQEKQKAVTESARKAVEIAVREARSLAGNRAFAEAKGILETIAGRMPDEFRPDLEREIGRLLDTEAALAAAELDAFERAADSVWKAVRALDFGTAEKALEDATGNAPKARAEQLREELDLCRGAWERLILAAQAAATGRDPFTVERSDPAGLQSPWTLREVSDSGRVRLTLDRVRDIKDDCDVLDLAPRTLVALIRRVHDAKGDEDIPIPILKGLCRLIRHVRGPARAWQLLFELPEIPQGMGSLREEYAKAGEAELGSAAARQRQKLKALQERIPGPPEADWIGLIQDLEALVATHRKLPGYGNHRKELRKVHEAACIERALVADQGVMLRTYFHGRVSRTQNGIRVTYNASSREHLEDFVRVLGDEPSIERGAILFHGEYRLLHGNPFRRRLRFEAQVADYDAKSPNLNVALWTHDGDLVTPERLEPPDRRSARLPDPKPKKYPNDFFVFAMGYAPRANNPEQFRAVGLRDLIEPSFVVLSGAHGSKKGRDQEGLPELWRTHILIPLEGKLRARNIVLELEPNGSFEWNIDGRKCYNPTVDPNSMWRDQLAKPDSEGSLSLFTNGSKVWYSEITIEGEINPKWLEIEAPKRHAKLRFDSLEQGSSIEPLIQKAR